MMTTYAPNGMEWLPTSETALLEAALAYAAHDLRVHPVWNLKDGRCACGSASCKPGKHPIGNGWQKKSSTDVDAVRDARRVHPHANVGLSMGGERRLVTIDIDGQSGRDSFAALEAKHGAAPETLTSRSGRADGGEHRIFSVPARLDMKRIKNRAATNGHTGIDTRGDNGQIVVAPSMHESGTRYEWTKRVPIATIPDWLFEAVATPRESSRTIPPTAPSSPSSNVTNIADKYIQKVISNAARDIAGAGDGQRNQLLFAKSATVFEYCVGANIPRQEVWLELANAARRCGLGDAEIEATLNKSWRAAQDSPRHVPAPRHAAYAAPEQTSTAPSSPPPALTPTRDWEGDLGRTADGFPKKTLPNVTTILACDSRWAGVIAFDDFGECVITTRPPPTRPQDAPANPTAGEWSDEDSIRTVNWLSTEHGIDVSTNVVDQAVAAVAMRKVVHPVRDYLNALVWDGVARLDGMLTTYFGAEDGPYARGIGSKWMISAVARVFEPGCQADCTLVLESKDQGVGKSTALEILAGRAWFADTGIVVGDKDSYQCLRRKWIYELGELAAVKGRDVERVKNFLSARSDNYRPSFGRRNRDFPRQVLFAGTTNENQYLVDRTGNRRFWPVRCGAIARALLTQDRDQLWAEARARYQAGERWHVDTPEFRALCIAEQADRVQSDPWEGIVATWLENPWMTSFDGVDGGVKRERINIEQGVLTEEVLLGALRMKVADITRADEMRVADVLRALGRVRGPVHRENGMRVRRYVVGEVVTGGAKVVTAQTVDPITDSSLSLLSSPNTDPRTEKSSGTFPSGHRECDQGGSGGDGGDSPHCFSDLLGGQGSGTE